MSVYDAKSLVFDGGLIREISIGGRKVYPVLPDGYTELDYIESAASQYIKTGVLVNPNYTVMAEFMVTKATTVWDTIFGTRSGNNARFTARYANTTSGQLGIQRSRAVGSSMESYNDSVLAKNKVTDGFHTIRLAKNKYYSDGVLRKTFNSATSTASYNYELYLFANNNAGTVGDAGYLRMRYVTIQDENNDWVRVFIPCLNPSGVAGMYDFVNDKFYGSASSKAFVDGPVRKVA
jgi:hypothetical protein